MIERFRQHWFISIFILCAAVAAGTWKVAHELLVEPRDYQIAQLKEEIQQLNSSALAPRLMRTEEDLSSIVLEQTGAFQNSSVTTRDGRCSIRILRISGEQVSLSVSVDANPPKEFERRPVGTRVSVDAGNDVYYIDLHRVRGNIVDLSVSRRKK